jgi:pyrroline-5-carboxylate reductase
VKKADNFRLGIIGCGNMGRALLTGVITNKVLPAGDIYVSDIEKEKLAGLKGIRKTTNKKAAEKAEVIIIAVKPDKVEKILKEIAELLTGKKILISIAAGISTGKIESLLAGKKIPVIRVMPNLNAKVKAGIFAYCGGRYAAGTEKFIEKIFSPSGVVLKLPEELFDTITAVSGSGPGYLFYIAEIIKEICMAKGIKAEDAKKIVSFLLLGTGKMLLETGEAPEKLKKMVCSPGGTTIEGLKILEKRNLAGILNQAIKKAEERSKQLSK